MTIIQNKISLLNNASSLSNKRARNIILDVIETSFTEMNPAELIKSNIKLDDGTKIFKGGPLENGCIIENIKTNNVYLNCRGTKVMYELGDKT